MLSVMIRLNSGHRCLALLVSRGPLHPTDTDALLHEQGRRMWTFPEILLSPGTSIAVYNRASLSFPLTVTKNRFAARVWLDTDASVSSQLLDHYAGALELSRLELAVILLRCLFSRDT
jgi:hypothetical protein